MKLSIIIPSVGDPYLEKTLEDIKQHTKSEHEVIVVDGREIGMRSAINKGMEQATGEYVIKTDEHCSFADGYDEILLSSIEDNWVVVPRRYELDIEKWERMERFFDYERLTVRPEKIGGVRWTKRSEKLRDIPIDETMVFQGSFYLMSRKHWDSLGGLQTEGYGEFAQEAVEVSLKTWLSGGKVMLNKNTWYAHKHRKFGRVKSPANTGKGNLFSRDYWLNNRWGDRKHDINWLFERFR